MRSDLSRLSAGGCGRIYRKEGRDFLYSGYWKVYGNLEDTLKTFEAYDQARDYVIGMTGSGNEIRDILAAS